MTVAKILSAQEDQEEQPSCCTKFIELLTHPYRLCKGYRTRRYFRIIQKSIVGSIPAFFDYLDLTLDLLLILKLIKHAGGISIVFETLNTFPSVVSYR